MLFPSWSDTDFSFLNQNESFRDTLGEVYLFLNLASLVAPCTVPCAYLGLWVESYQSKFELVIREIYANDLYFPLGQSAGTDFLLYFCYIIRLSCSGTKNAVSAVNVVCHALQNQ